MAITLSTIRADIAFRFRDADNNFLPSNNTRLDGWANEIQQDIARRTQCFREIAAMRLTIGQLWANLPADFISLVEEPMYRSAYRIRTYGSGKWFALPDRVSGNTTGTAPFVANLRRNRVNGTSAWRLWLYPAPSANSTNTTLNGAITSGATSLVLTDASSFPSAGHILIDSEEIYYGSKTGNTLNNLQRGLGATTAASHLDLATVYWADLIVLYARIPATITTTVDAELSDDDYQVLANGILAIAYEADRQIEYAKYYRALYNRGIMEITRKYSNADESSDNEIRPSPDYSWTYGHIEGSYD